jgi:hypothetical protein
MDCQGLKTGSGDVVAPVVCALRAVALRNNVNDSAAIESLVGIPFDFEIKLMH